MSVELRSACSQVFSNVIHQINQSFRHIREQFDMAILKTAITGIYKEQFIIINRQINYLKLNIYLNLGRLCWEGQDPYPYDLKGEELKISLFPSILAFLQAH